jgi:hypothetical protein
MTVIATSSPVLSDVLMQDNFPVVENFNYQHNVSVDEASTKTYRVGQVVMWDNSLSAYRQIVAGDFTGDAINVPAQDGSVANGAKFGVVVGFDALGDVRGDVSVTTAGDKVVLLFRGPASVKKSGLRWDAGLNAAKIASVSAQLEKQGVAVKNVASAVTSTYYGV